MWLEDFNYYINKYFNYFFIIINTSNYKIC